jgi:hypothetical protein
MIAPLSGECDANDEPHRSSVVIEGEPLHERFAVAPPAGVRRAERIDDQVGRQLACIHPGT